MAPKLFLLGSTGYIGGTVLDTIVKEHPEYEITALLRNVPENFSKLYPNVHILRGDYDNADVITEASSKSNIVIHNGNSDHEPGLNSIIAGLLKRSEPSFLIHLSGTGIVADWHDPTYIGKLNPKIWSDIDDLDEIASRPDGELHRHTEKLLFQAAAEHGDKLKIAIMCPPDIYGPGRGPGKRESIYFPTFWSEIKNVGAAFYGGEGTNTRSWVHIEDFMTVYLKVIEAAAAGGEGADWGKEGYYFASSQEASQIDMARAAGKILKAHGRLDTAEPKGVSLDTVKGMMSEASKAGYPGLGTCVFAGNSRTRADRATKLFGYEPKALSLWEAMEADLRACGL
ncbi:NAD(P)-binding protein [Mycena galopus ATCC 62051]|nr:NAD(P)-binding protein [Mycena galopus ATCC 62051]